MLKSLPRVMYAACVATPVPRPLRLLLAEPRRSSQILRRREIRNKKSMVVREIPAIVENPKRESRIFPGVSLADAIIVPKKIEVKGGRDHWGARAQTLGVESGSMVPRRLRPMLRPAQNAACCL
jgi:hypothetical protein